ncbi:MAG: CBS domain-containing protein [Deltaproteobacteria bacterium]|nr:CBS domain-containing protein [Deltaproteobacteria bacterium]
MRPMPTVVDAMTPFPYTIESSEPLKSAITIMYAKSIRHLPVVQGNVLVGLLSDRDVKLAMAVSAGKAEQDNLKVDDVCIHDPYVVPHTEKLNVVLDCMVEDHIGSALVVKGGKLVGIFTVTDACRKLSELLRLSHPDA